MVSETLNLDTEVFIKLVAFAQKEKTNNSRAANTLLKRGFAYTAQLNEKNQTQKDAKT